MIYTLLTRLALRVIVALAAVGVLFPSLPPAACAAPRRPAAALTDQPMVWGMGGACGANLYTSPTRPYGALHPLDQSGVPDRANLPHVTVAECREAGLDGLAFDLIGHVGQMASTTMKPLLMAATQDGFLLAPYYEVTDKSENPPASASTLIARATAFYLDYWNTVQANHYTAAARQPDGSLIVFNSHMSSLSPAGWQTVRDNLTAKGCHFCWISNMDTSPDLGSIQSLNDPSNAPGLSVSQQIASYFPGTDASYIMFAYRWGAGLNQIAGDNNRLVFGPVQPGYDREVPAGSPYVDAQGTLAYRTQWEQTMQMPTAPRWITCTTWSDVMEHTDIFPDSEWNLTRVDLTAWYASQFRGQARPFSNARLYITTPQALHPNQASQAEALVLNPTADTVTATVRLYDASGNAVGSPVSAAIAPNSLGAATLPLNFGTPPTGTFYRAQATLSDNGVTLSAVLSAPVCVYTTPCTDRYSRILYYSVPAYAALPGTPQISLTGHVAGQFAAGALAAVTPPAGTTVRSAEVLYNTWEVNNFFNVLPFALTIPAKPITNYFNQPPLTTKAPGFVVGRVIDANGRVGYSDPLYLSN